MRTMPFLDPGATCVGTVETGPWRRAPNMVARRAKRSKVVRMLLTSAFGEPHWDKIKASGPRPKHLGKSLPKYHPYDGTVWIFMVKCGYNIHGMLWVWEVQEALESNNIFFGKEALKMFLLQQEVLSHVYRFVFVLNRVGRVLQLHVKFPPRSHHKRLNPHILQ